MSTAPRPTTRLPGIDALRIIGAVLVVGLHVGLFPEWPVAAMEFSRASGRWVVPFFFLVMGFFIGQRPALAETALATGGRVLQMLLICSAIYGLLLLARVGPRDTLVRLLSPETMVRGVAGHLWFLHAALAALLLAAARPDWLVSRRAWPVLTVVLLGWCVFDALFALKRIDWGMMFASRFIAGLALVWMGMKLAHLAPRALGKRWLPLLALGTALMIGQGLVIAWRGGEPAELQLPIGAIVLGVAALAAGLMLPSTPAVEQLADWGRRYALGLYLLHPLAIEALRLGGIVRSDASWALAVPMTLALLMVLERWFPAAKARLDGRAPLAASTGGRPARTSN